MPTDDTRDVGHRSFWQVWREVVAIMALIGLILAGVVALGALIFWHLWVGIPVTLVLGSLFIAALAQETTNAES